MLGKACCWNILPFFPSVVFQDCSDLVLLWPQETEKKKANEKRRRDATGWVLPCGDCLLAIRLWESLLDVETVSPKIQLRYNAG